MKKIRATAFFCTLLFALGAFAFQNPGSQSNSGQTATSPSQQSTQPSQAEPSTQTSPSMQSTPSMQGTPSTAPGQQGQAGQGQLPNIDNQVRMLTDQLNLTPDQQSKVRVVLVDQHEQAMGLVKDNTLSREDKMAKIHSLREGTIAKIRQVLTDDQKPKFDQMIAAQDERIKQREQGGGSTTPGSTPPSGTSPSSTPPSTTSPSSTPPSGSSSPSSTQPPSNPPSNKPPQ